MTLASQEINRAKCELFERGWSQRGPVTDEGQICIMVALTLGRGIALDKALVSDTKPPAWAQQCQAARHVAEAIEELHGDKRMADDDVFSVWRWNDKIIVGERKFDEVIEVLDLAEKKALIHEESMRDGGSSAVTEALIAEEAA